MLYKVLLFGPQATLANQREIEITTPGDSITVADLLQQIGEQYPQLKASLATSQLAVGQQFAKPGDLVSADKELALIGMVSGG